MHVVRQRRLEDGTGPVLPAALQVNLRVELNVEEGVLLEGHGDGERLDLSSRKLQLPDQRRAHPLAEHLQAVVKRLQAVQRSIRHLREEDAGAQVAPA